MIKKTDPTDIQSLKSPFEKNANKIWIASTIKLIRNLENFKFLGKIDLQIKEQIIDLVENQLKNKKQFSHLACHHSKNLSPIEKEFLFEHTLSQQSFHQTHKEEAFIVDSVGKKCILVNIHDHLQFFSLDCEGELEKSYGELVQLESAFGQNFRFAFLPKFGFLTVDPFESGTALRIFTFLQVPALVYTKQIKMLCNQYGEKEHFTFTGMLGDPNNLLGNILAIHNSHTIGMTEESLISSIRSISTKIMLDEKSARAQLKKEQPTALKNMVSRAYGLVKFSYQLQTVETLDAISFLKLGLDLEWIHGTDIETLNKLFFGCRRAHLQSQFECNGDTTEEDRVRAEYMQKELNAMTCDLK